MKIDNPINLIVNKLIFGADFDLEDVISVLENYPDLRSNEILLHRLKEFNVLEKFKQLLSDHFSGYGAAHPDIYSMGQN